MPGHDTSFVWRISFMPPLGGDLSAESYSEPRPLGGAGQPFSARSCSCKPRNPSKFSTAFWPFETRLYSKRIHVAPGFPLENSWPAGLTVPSNHLYVGTAFQSLGDCFASGAIYGSAFSPHGPRTLARPSRRLLLPSRGHRRRLRP